MGHEDDRDTRVRVARDGARLLQDHRERHAPPPEVAEASWQALRRRIAAGEPGPLTDEDDPPAPARAGVAWRRWTLAAAAAAALALWQLAPGRAGRGDAASGHAASLQQVEGAEPQGAAHRQDSEPVPRNRSSGTGSGDGARDGAAPAPGEDAPELAAPGPGRPGPKDSDRDRASPGLGDMNTPRGPGGRSGGSAPRVPEDRSGTSAPRGPGDGSSPVDVEDSEDSSGETPPAGRGEPDTGLGRELAALRGVVEALRAGHGGEALARADAYLQAHPSGSFVPEARLHRAEALCLLGRTDDARAAGKAFARDLPDSPLRARAVAVCGAP